MTSATPARKTAAKKTAAKVQAAKSEAVPSDKPTTFTHRGVPFTLPHPLDFPLEVLETDDEVEVTRLILGDEQWAAYRATKPTIRDFYELTEAMSEARGRDADSGN
ncbi:hypothetical protein AB0J38_41185 [Streptomyces sp. NPDC050095]|uniref:hypothetical protein n=1 Tax=unclassified Streptomyces TaxID=2593676 RepID=UPI003423CC04